MSSEREGPDGAVDALISKLEEGACDGLVEIARTVAASIPNASPATEILARIVVRICRAIDLFAYVPSEDDRSVTVSAARNSFRVLEQCAKKMLADEHRWALDELVRIDRNDPARRWRTEHASTRSVLSFIAAVAERAIADIDPAAKGNRVYVVHSHSQIRRAADAWSVVFGRRPGVSNAAFLALCQGCLGLKNPDRAVRDALL